MNHKAPSRQDRESLWLKYDGSLFSGETSLQAQSHEAGGQHGLKKVVDCTPVVVSHGLSTNIPQSQRPWLQSFRGRLQSYHGHEAVGFVKWVPNMICFHRCNRNPPISHQQSLGYSRATHGHVKSTVILMASKNSFGLTVLSLCISTNRCHQSKLPTSRRDNETFHINYGKTFCAAENITQQKIENQS